MQNIFFASLENLSYLFDIYSVKRCKKVNVHFLAGSQILDVVHNIVHVHRSDLNNQSID